MIDNSTSIWRHHLLINDYQNAFLIDILPKNQPSIPLDIVSELESIFCELDSDQEMNNQLLINFSEIVGQYGHSIHPYIASTDISKLISLLDYPDLQEILLSLLWSCSFLSPDIVGYFIEADSFIHKIITIFFSDIDLESKLTIMKLLHSCISQSNELSSILVDENFFNELIPYCEESTDFLTLSSIILFHCQIDENFIRSAFPIMKLIISNSTDHYSISRILYVLSQSNEENDPERTIIQYMLSEYIEQLDNFLSNETDILLTDATITMLNTIVATGDIDTLNCIYSCGIINSILMWLFNVSDISSDANENNKLSILILSFLYSLLEVSNSNKDLISYFIDIFFQNDFIEFCKVSSFVIYEKTILLILDTALCCLEIPQTQELFTEELIEIIIQIFESSEDGYRKELCNRLHCILLFYQDDTDFCDAIISMWMQNDICVNFCSDLIADELFVSDS